VQTTLDADLQAQADAALAGWTGAVVILEARSGDILAMVSKPGYDPNLLDEHFEELEEDENEFAHIINSEKPVDINQLIQHLQH
jgi:peptidoglycan glycosyltransferase